MHSRRCCLACDYSVKFQKFDQISKIPKAKYFSGHSEQLLIFFTLAPLPVPPAPTHTITTESEITADLA